MSITGVVRGYFYTALFAWVMWKARHSGSKISLKRANWKESLNNPTEFYFECLRAFQQELHPKLREHRMYFRRNRRGFGENVFHVMWSYLLQEFKPENFLEIGVYRGQVISLVALWSRIHNHRCEVYGISPFSPAGDSVSRYREDVDYYKDTLINFDHFSLSHPRLLRAYSTDPVAVELIKSKTWDMVYIDGNHEYEAALQDWNNCSSHVKAGGIIVLDDSALTTSLDLPSYVGTRGHPGPSRVAQEIDSTRFKEILQVGHNRVFQKTS